MGERKEELLKFFEEFGNKRITHISKSKKYERIYKLILIETEFLDEVEPSLSQRIFHIKNNLTEIPKCKECNINNVKWKSVNYLTFCSCKCSRNNEGVKNRYKQSMLETHGVEFPYQSNEIFEKFKSSCVKNLGTEFPSQNYNVKQKITNTFQNRYGINHNSQIHYDENIFQKINDKNFLYEEHVLNNKTLTKISQELGVDHTTISEKCKYFDIPIKRYSFSNGEKELGEFLKKHFSIITGDRTQIKPFELDIFIPEKSIAIEYCGLYWHSTIKKPDVNYHFNKFEMCKSKCIRLITIYEDEWLNKRELVEKKLLHILGVSTEQSVFARKCEIKLISKKEKKNFYNAYHIQGDCDSSIDVGLVLKTDIIASMSFKKRVDGVYELVRYSTAKRVLGGFGKLLNYFKRTYKWDTIITFSDRRWHDGNLYFQNNFILEKVLKADYEYIVNNIRYHKFNFRKSRLKKKFPDVYSEELTEEKMTTLLGFRRIYDCGKLRFVLKNRRINNDLIM